MLSAQQLRPQGRKRKTVVRDIFYFNGHSFGGKYAGIKLNEFLQYTDKFGDPNFPGEMTTSVWLKEVSVGTEIKILQENIPSLIPVEMYYLGWWESLEKLTKLVEPEILEM